MSRRGEVVLVDYPYSDGGSKIRPALVVQNDRDNARLAKTVIVMITGNLHGPATHRTYWSIPRRRTARLRPEWQTIGDKGSGR